VEGRDLVVTDLDAVDETPVLDIAPYFEQMGPRGLIQQPTWPGEMLADYWLHAAQRLGGGGGGEPVEGGESDARAGRLLRTPGDLLSDLPEQRRFRGEATVVRLFHTLETADERQDFHLATIGQRNFADRTGPEFSQEGRGEYLLQEIPLTAEAIDGANLMPPEIAAVLRDSIEEGTLLGFR